MSYDDAIQKINEEFPDQSHPSNFIAEARSNTATFDLADYTQTMLETEEIKLEDEQLYATQRLNWRQREKHLSSALTVPE